MIDVKKMKVDYGEYWLIFEQNPDKTYMCEVWCYLENKSTHQIIQDIAIIRKPYKYINLQPITNDNQVEVLVYGDSQDEDYTDKFNIDIYKEEN